MALKFFNTASRSLEECKPLRGKTVRIYSCGPTVYDFAHVGNFRTYLFVDFLRRTLELEGYKVRQVMNITDVGHLASDADEGEDRMEKGAVREGKSAWDIAKFYTSVFLRDMKSLNMERPTVLPRATAHIREQITLIKILEQKGFTYQTSDGIYFDTSKCSQYGKLVPQKLEEKEAGARISINNEKRQSWDFALWKFSPTDRTREMEWKSPWGMGFPGWHVECSAMSHAYLGQPFDIHTGGMDLAPVHHTNEIAQSEAAYGVPLAHIWMHGDFLLVDNGRMGKSLGNLITLSEIQKRGIDPVAYRYFVLGAHYRSKLNFTWEALGAAANALTNLRELARELPKPRGRSVQFQEKFLSALNNDLNTPEALAVVWELMKSDEPGEKKSGTLAWFDRVLGLGLEKYIAKPLRIPAIVKKLMTARETARREKDFTKADALRNEILEKGFIIEDSNTGQKIRQK